MKKKIYFIVGPTASGKSAVALHLAKKINAEIISCDSMQLYRGMDIITSQPPAAFLKKVPHHLIGFVSPEKEYDVARYRKAAVACMNRLFKKGKAPLFVGGTGLYVSILLDGIFKGAPEDPAVRAKLYREAQHGGNELLHQRLNKVDPRAAAKIHCNDTRRIVRALEVLEVSGKPISQLQVQRKGLAAKYDVRILCLNLPRQALYERINQRVEAMFMQGLVLQAHKLMRVRLSRTAQYAIGIRQIKEYSEGKISLDEARELIKRDTRWYAKRQLTWFRKDRRIRWLEAGVDEAPAHIAKRADLALR